MRNDPGSDLSEAELEALPMSPERLQTPEMQTLIRDAERRAVTGRPGDGSTTEDPRMARERRDLDPRASARGEAG